jgi:hypothetical protein
MISLKALHGITTGAIRYAQLLYNITEHPDFGKDRDKAKEIKHGIKCHEAALRTLLEEATKFRGMLEMAAERGMVADSPEEVAQALSELDSAFAEVTQPN